MVHSGQAVVRTRARGDVVSGGRSALDGWTTTTRNPPRSGRPARFSFAIQESIGRLRECGVPGDDDTLADLLEGARFDVDRAASAWFDRGSPVVQVVTSAEEPSGGIAASRVDAGIHYSSTSNSAEALELRGNQYSSRTPTIRKQKRASRTDGGLPSTCVGEGRAHGKSSSSYAAKSNGKRQLSSRVSLIRSESQDLPSGVHYEANVGESYDVDVKRMIQTHVESGSMRKVRREKPGLWRFDKRGSTWGVYPPEVSIELDRIFLRLGRGGGSWDRREVPDKSTPTARSPLAVPQSAIDPLGFSIASIAELNEIVVRDSLSPEALSVACELLFSAAEAGSLVEIGQAAALLSEFSARHELSCDVSFARRAGLVVGSMCLLRAVFTSTPELSLVGEDIFDKKYPKLSLQNLGRKNCVRCLLARGMKLGDTNCVPHGKLLRKVEADAEPAWARRWLDSMLLAFPELPETAVGRVWELLGLSEEY
eukprot:TRINITY_DN68934_c0_g1_i1.p1 TRINITY_DN68934_c0_g1~~TRINITY_DN68934_c0_g1_i1.p1  ORF type:complete len:481 (-),score=44.74 TRINITY_DN68934_c0_g1_i1:29-1471(-)